MAESNIRIKIDPEIEKPLPEGVFYSLDKVYT